MDANYPAFPTIRAIEEASINAWPARRQFVDDGWLIRFHDGYTRRANSINPLHPATGADGSLAARLEKWERFYWEQKRPAIFKITPLVQPTDLDARLDERGYALEAPTGVRIRSLAERPAPPAEIPGGQAHLERALTAEWLASYTDFSAVHAQDLPPIRGILENLGLSCCFVTQWVDGRPVAAGLGVKEGGLFGLYDIVTSPNEQGKGYGVHLLHALLDWAWAEGASHAYLAVMDDNAPARRLYDKWGFREVYKYWYRVRNDSDASSVRAD